MDQGELLLLIYSHFPAKASPCSCEAIKDIFQIYGKRLSHSEVQDRGENFSIGAAQRKKIPFYPFFSGDLQREETLRMSVPLLPLLSALPGSRSWVEKNLNWDCAPALKEKGVWGDFLVPGAAQEGNSGHGEPGNSWRGLAGGIHPGGVYLGGFMEEEFIQEEFTQEGFIREGFIREKVLVHGKGVRTRRNLISSS